MRQHKDYSIFPSIALEYFDGDLIIMGGQRNGGKISGLFLNNIIVDGDIIFNCGFSKSKTMPHIYVMIDIACRGKIIMPDAMFDIFDNGKIGDFDEAVYPLYRNVNQRVRQLPKPADLTKFNIYESRHD